MGKNRKKVLHFFLFVFAISMSLAFFKEAGAENPTDQVDATEPTETPKETASPEPSETPKPELEGIYIKKKPDKVKYENGEKFDQTGLRVYAIYEGGEEEEVNPDSVKGFTGKTGINVITVSYKGFTDQFEVLVLPAGVKDFKVKENTMNSFTLTWSKVEDAKGYELLRFNPQINSFEVIAELTDTTYKEEGLPSGSKYRYMIRPYILVDGKKEYGPYSNELDAATKPGKVGGLRVQSTETNAVTLQWDPVGGDVNYIVYQLNTNTMQYKKVGTTADTWYRIADLKVATVYTYVVRAFTLDESNVGEESTELKVMTRPRTTEITVRNGDHRVRLNWDKVKEATGYIIWMKSESDAEYVQVMVINDVNVKTYVVMGLDELKNYSFYVQTYTIAEDGMMAESEASLIKGIYISKFPGTSFKASIYSTVKKFKKSSAYKSYNGFKSALNLSLSFNIPGIKYTNVNGFISTTMCPQAITTAGSYMLMTAYDKNDVDSSVIYVLDQKTKKYLITVALPDKFHVGGIAYDGTNIWVSNGKKVACIKYSSLKKLVKAGVDGVTIDYVSICSVSTQSSYITYNNNRLWVGETNEKSSKNMYSYEIVNKTGIPSLKRKNRILLPSRTQGLVFLKDGTMMLSVSNQTGPSASKYYVSQLRIYKPSWKSAKNTGLIKKNKCQKVIAMPPMIEGMALRGKYVYATFESAAFAKCKQPVDRICALKVSNLLKKTKK